MLDETGLSYICQTYERFSHVAMILVSCYPQPIFNERRVLLKLLRGRRRHHVKGGGLCHRNNDLVEELILVGRVYRIIKNDYGSLEHCAVLKFNFSFCRKDQNDASIMNIAVCVSVSVEVSLLMKIPNLGSCNFQEQDELTDMRF